MTFRTRPTLAYFTLTKIHRSFLRLSRVIIESHPQPSLFHNCAKHQSKHPFCLFVYFWTTFRDTQTVQVIILILENGAFVFHCAPQPPFFQYSTKEPTNRVCSSGNERLFQAHVCTSVGLSWPWLLAHSQKDYTPTRNIIVWDVSCQIQEVCYFLMKHALNLMIN